MARELSQAELLDFLCQAGGRVANAALLGHFKRFLRDPQAPPAQLQHRRQLFKGFVNSVATVSQDGPGAATYVVLRKRYRDLVGEEPRPTPHDGHLAEPPPPPPPLQGRAGRSPPPPPPLQGRAGRSPPPPPPLQGRAGKSPPPPPPLQQARWERAGRSREAASPREIPGPDGSGRLSDGQPAAGRRAAKCPSGTPGAGPRPPLPASPTLGCLGREKKRHRPPLAEPAAPDPPLLQERAQRSNGLGLPVGEMGALPSAGSAQQRIRDWIVTHHSAAAEPFRPLKEEEKEEDAWPVRAGSQSSELRACRPWGSLDFGPRSESSEGWRDPPVPVFRSIRCRLSLQDLEDHLEQESSASEEGSSSASWGSSSHRGEGETGRTNNGCIRNSAGCQGPGGTPHSNGLAGMTFAQASQDSKNGKSPPHVALLHRVVGRAAILGKAEGGALLKPKLRKMDGPASPTLDAPLSPWLAARQRSVANAPFVERLDPNSDGLAEHRSSLVPLDGREHTWLVKIAAGSWMQVRALLQEDPQLVLHKDFISGFTVLHWLAKHGNAQVLQDFVTGAQEAGIALDVNVRSGCGYTPLHLAAIHSHPLIMKILVQKLQCRTQVRDSSGKKPWQYLSTSASGEIWQLLGGPRGRTIFPTHPIIRPSMASSSSSVPLARKVSRKPSLANYLKPQHMKWKVGYMCPIVQETEEYSD